MGRIEGQTESQLPSKDKYCFKERGIIQAALFDTAHRLVHEVHKIHQFSTFICLSSVLVAGVSRKRGIWGGCCASFISLLNKQGKEEYVRNELAVDCLIAWL